MTLILSMCGFSLFISLLCSLPINFNSTESFTKKPLLSDELKVKNEKVDKCAEGTLCQTSESLPQHGVRSKQNNKHEDGRDIKAAEKQAAPSYGSTSRVDDDVIKPEDFSTNNVQSDEYVPTPKYESTADVEPTPEQNTIPLMQKLKRLLTIENFVYLSGTIILILFIYQFLKKHLPDIRQKFSCRRSEEEDQKGADPGNAALVVFSKIKPSSDSH